MHSSHRPWVICFEDNVGFAEIIEGLGNSTLPQFMEVTFFYRKLGKKIQLLGELVLMGIFPIDAFLN